jgi:uncharacterized protein YbaR (Trm112 family)
VDPELLSILQCPVSRESLRFASETEIARLNAALARAILKNQSEGPAATAVNEFLICDSCQLCFPIVNGFPILLPEDAIKLY